MYKSLVLLLLVCCFSANKESIAQCNHKHGFERSVAADTIDALHYKIHIQSIDFAAKSFQAEANLTLLPKVSLNHFPLELKALQVTSVMLGNQLLPYQQSGDVVHIQTIETFTPDDTIQLKITYGGIPFHEAWGGFHFSGNYAFNLGVGFESDPHNLGKAWFPCVDDFQDRATYEVLITLPETMTGIAGGLLSDTIHHGNGMITWHWSLNQPIPTYLASVAAGNYSLTESVYQGLDKQLPVTIYTRPSDTLKVAGSFLNLHQILTNFENRFGPYPFDRIGYTGTSIGAMEHVTNIAYPHSAINGNLTSEYLLTHELSHMWFGDLVTCADAGDMWLNEGWATFCHHFYKHDLYNPSVYRTEMNSNHLDVLKNAHLTDGSYLSLHDVPTQYTYGTTVYDKGATVVHTLMNYLGQDVFFEAVRAYLQHFAFQHASSGDMRDFLSNYTGVDLTDFFETWVFTPGTPHFSIDSMNINPEGTAFKAELYLKQKHKGYQHTANNNILEVTFVGSNWEKHTDTVHFSGKTGNSSKIVPFEPLLVLSDFYDKTADATTDLDGVIRTIGELSLPTLHFKLFTDVLPDSAFYRFTHNWVAPDSLKEPIAGLQLSPYRHWEMNGIFAENTSMRGRFFYSNTSTLDASLILSEQDSVVVLYRSSPADDWHEVPQTREGLWNIGYIIVNDFKPGQYTLAVWDSQIVGIHNFKGNPSKLELKVEPNPVRENLLLRWTDDQHGNITVIDSTGKIVHQTEINKQKEVNIATASWAKGWYFAELRNQYDTLIGFAKFIVQ